MLPVCEKCKPLVKKCPICRGCILFNQNTVVGQICLIAEHKCKYHTLGCPIKMRIHEIDEHEQNCPERTIKCPFRKIFTEVFLQLNMETLLLHNLELKFFCKFYFSDKYFILYNRHGAIRNFATHIFGYFTYLKF